MRLYDEIMAEEKCKAENRDTGEDLLCSIYEDRKLSGRQEKILKEILEEEWYGVYNNDSFIISNNYYKYCFDNTYYGT